MSNGYRRKAKRKVNRATIWTTVIVLLFFVVSVGVVIWAMMSTSDIRADYDKKLQAKDDEREKNHVEVFAAAVDIPMGTVLTLDLMVTKEVYSSEAREIYLGKNDIGKEFITTVKAGQSLLKAQVKESIVETTTREREIKFINIPENVSVNDYIDVRILYPDGTDFVVLAKKQIIGMKDTRAAMTLWLDEEEQEMLNAAAVDVLVYEGAELCCVRYVQPEVQAPAIVTYTPSAQTLQLLAQNPNITELTAGFLIPERRASIEQSLALYSTVDATELFDDEGRYVGTDNGKFDAYNDIWNPWSVPDEALPEQTESSEDLLSDIEQASDSSEEEKINEDREKLDYEEN